MPNIFQIKYGNNITKEDYLFIINNSNNVFIDLMTYLNNYLAIITCMDSIFYIKKSYYNGKIREIQKFKKNELRKLLNHLEYYKNIDTNKFKNVKIIDEWFKYIHKKTYPKLVYFPLHKNENYHSDNLNLFMGFNHTYNPNFIVNNAKFSLIMKYLYEIVSNNNEAGSFYFLLNLLANIIQKPRIKHGICIIYIASEFDINKNIFFEWFGKNIIGGINFLNTINIHNIIGRFNDHQENKLFTIINQSNTTDGNNILKRIKPLVTQNKITIEKRYRDPYISNNFNNYMIISNDKWITKIEKSDRRYFCLRANNIHINDNNYINNLKQELSNPDSSLHFFHYLMNKEITSLYTTKILDTQYRIELKN